MTEVTWPPYFLGRPEAEREPTAPRGAPSAGAEETNSSRALSTGSCLPRTGIPVISDPAFSGALNQLDTVALDLSSDVVCVLDTSLVLRAYNPAWRRFAEENGGADVLERFGIGVSILAAIPDPLLAFYAARYSQALLDRRPFEHDYDCSTPGRYRRFHQTASPLPDGSGLMVRHRLAVEREIDESSPIPWSAYRRPDGNVVQCMHCRKVRLPAVRDRWDWVPALVAHPLAEISHTLCPRCLGFYYPELIPDTAGTV